MKKTVLILFLFFFINRLFAYDKLFEFKLKLQKSYESKKEWKYLKVDKKFKLDRERPEAFMKYPICIALYNNKFYIIDHMGHKIVIFDKSGGFLRMYKSIGKGPGDFHFPLWIEFYKKRMFLKHYSAFDVFDDNIKFVKRIKSFVHFKKFTFYKDNIYCAFVDIYKGRYPIIIKMDMTGKILRYYCDNDLDKSKIRVLRFGSNVVLVKDKIYYIPENWNGLYEFDYNLNLISKGKIKYPLLDRFKEWDKKAPKKPGFLWPAHLIKSAKVYKERIFVLLGMPRLEILEIDKRGNILNHYYNNKFFKYMRWYDFVIEKEGKNLVFYLLGQSTGENVRGEKLENNVYKVYIKDE